MASELRVDRIIPVNGVPTGGGGGIVQVKHVDFSTTQASVNSTSYQDSGLSIDFTPIRSDSKILVRATFNVLIRVSNSWDECFAMFALREDSTYINETGVANRWGTASSAGRIQIPVVMEAFVDSNNTNSRTYKVQGRVTQSEYYFIAHPQYVYADGSGRLPQSGSSINSNITVMEISA